MPDEIDEAEMLGMTCKHARISASSRRQVLAGRIELALEKGEGFTVENADAPFLIAAALTVWNQIKSRG